MEFLIWFFIGSIVYCYFGYPFGIFLYSLIFGKKVKKAKNFCPKVSIILSVWNEEDVIKEKLENLLGLEYPVELFEIIIGSDGSTDKTNEIIQKYVCDDVKLFPFSERRGKPSCLNDLIEKAQGEIIVFTDARQQFASDALKELVSNFADKEVGCVSGELVFHKALSQTGEGVGLYWTYEKFIRRNESAVYSTIGATGAIYAIRKELYKELPSQIILDDVYLPLAIVQQGFRCVFDNNAVAYDCVAQSAREEFTRKVRTLAGNYQMFVLFKELFNPARSRIAIQIFSHKLLRVVVPFLMILIFILNACLLDTPGYGKLFSLQIVFYILAILGNLAARKKYAILERIRFLTYVPYVFCMLNGAAIFGLYTFLFKTGHVQWKKARDL